MYIGTQSIDISYMPMFFSSQRISQPLISCEHKCHDWIGEETKNLRVYDLPEDDGAPGLLTLHYQTTGVRNRKAGKGEGEEGNLEVRVDKGRGKKQSEPAESSLKLSAILILNSGPH